LGRPGGNSFHLEMNNQLVILMEEGQTVESAKQIPPAGRGWREAEVFESGPAGNEEPRARTKTK